MACFHTSSLRRIIEVISAQVSLCLLGIPYEGEGAIVHSHYLVWVLWIMFVNVTTP